MTAKYHLLCTGIRKMMLMSKYRYIHKDRSFVKKREMDLSSSPDFTEIMHRLFSVSLEKTHIHIHSYPTVNDLLLLPHVLSGHDCLSSVSMGRTFVFWIIFFFRLWPTNLKGPLSSMLNLIVMFVQFSPILSKSFPSPSFFSDWFSLSLWNLVIWMLQSCSCLRLIHSFIHSSYFSIFSHSRDWNIYSSAHIYSSV